MKAKPEADYAIVVEQLAEADGGGWLASVPTLHGCYGDGETRTAALEEWKDAARQLGREVPGPASPGQWRLRVPRTLHDKLRRLAAADGVSLNQLVTTLRGGQWGDAPRDG